VIRQLRIKDIVRDAKYQGRVRLDLAAVRRYEAKYKAGTEMDPVSVAMLNSAPILLDGWHRIQALENLGRLVVAAKVVKVTSAREVKLLAAQANLEQGLYLKAADIKRCFLMYLDGGGHLDARGQFTGYEKLGQVFGKSKATVWNWTRRHRPRIAAQFAREEQARWADLGLPRKPIGTPEDNLADSVSRALDTALAAFRGITDDAERGFLIKRADAMLAAMRSGSANDPLPDGDALETEF
jgi:hypothetical protein